MRSHMIVAVAGVLFLASVASAQVERGDWELTLAGTGTSNKDFDEHAVGVRASLGWFVFNRVELSLRQQFTYSKLQGSSTADAGTQVAIDLNWPLDSQKHWVPYIGGNAGYFYGDTFGDDFEAAPEIGLKYFVDSRTFIYVQAEYQIFFTSASSGSGNNDDRQFIYQIGIGFRF